MNKFLTNLGQTFSDDEKTVIKNKLESILGTDQTKMAWIPTVADNGLISWTLASYTTQPPETMNIKGPQGEAGENGKDGDPGTSVTIENIETITGGRKVIFSDGNEITIYDGKDGAGVAIKGTVDDVADLPSTAENGDAYIVKNDNGKLYVYANGWPDEGVAFTGPKGADGDTPTLAFIENSQKTGIDIFVNGGEEPVNTIPYATDGHSPIITTSATSTGNDIYIDGTKAFSVTNGINGTSGKDGYTPSLTISSVTSTEHTAGGTELKFTYPESWQTDVVFTAWNGNDGKDWEGTTGRLLQGDYIKLTPTGDDLEISVTGDFVTSSTIVGSDQYALTTAGWAKVQGGGEAFTGVELAADSYLSGAGTDDDKLGIDVSALADEFLPLSGGAITAVNSFLGLSSRGKISIRMSEDNNFYGDIHTNYNENTTGVTTGPEMWLKAGNGEGFTDAHNGSCVRIGVGRTTEDTSIGRPASYPIGILNGNTGNGWPTTYIYGQMIHSAGTTSATTWENDNTLHFILE